MKYDSRELARISRAQAPSEAEWDARIAAGTPASSSRIARTLTLDDPLTTSLLAEVARRLTTIDVSPDQIDEVHDLEPAPEREIAPHPGPVTGRTR
ncbi:MAG TPA: hypothetical protein VFK02_07205 [Kofleriaceae bacterium]|nr:hypothetical protein [Kofleriaceae bacterium]